MQDIARRITRSPNRRQIGHLINFRSIGQDAEETWKLRGGEELSLSLWVQPAGGGETAAEPGMEYSANRRIQSTRYRHRETVQATKDGPPPAGCTQSDKTQPFPAAQASSAIRNVLDWNVLARNAHADTPRKRGVSACALRARTFQSSTFLIALDACAAGKG